MVVSGNGRRPKVQCGAVHDDLAPARGEDANERTDDGNVELTVRTAPDHQDLGFGDAVDVVDAAQLGAVRVTNGRTDHLVPEVFAPRQPARWIEDGLQVGAPERFGRGPVRHLAEGEAPARAIRNRSRRPDGQRGLRALPVEARARPEPILGMIGQDLDANGAAHAMDAPDQANDQALTRVQVRGSRG